MTTRRDLFIIAGGVAAMGGTAVLTGCREQSSAAAAVPDVLLAESRHGLVVLGGARPHGLGSAATVSLDGAVVYAVNRDQAGGSLLVRLDPADGVPTRSIALGGGWIPRVISSDGRACALSRTGASVRPAARARTTLLVTTDGRQQQRYDLDRLLDLTSGAVQPLLTRNKVPVPAGAEEEMHAEGRQAVLSDDRQVLYTLYTHQPDHRHTRDLIAGRPGNVHAFVHILNLTERWAYCLDLPLPFGEGPAEGHAIAIGAGGRQLAVVDMTSGSLAYADTAALTIERVVVSLRAADGAASLAFAPDGRRIFAGVGTTVTVLDSGNDAVTARWSVPGTIRGLGLSPDATRVYAGGTDEIVWLDAGSGTLQGRAPVDGLTALRVVR